MKNLNMISLVLISILLILYISPIFPSMGADTWVQNYGDDIAYLSDGIITSEDKLVLAGHIAQEERPNGGTVYYDGLIIQTEEDGEVKWEQHYGDDGNNFIRSIIQSTDGGFVAAGETGPKQWISGLNDGWIIKIDANGTLQWNNSYGRALTSDEDEILHSVIESSTGDFISVGETRSLLNRSIWLVKVDNEGNHQWNQTYARASLNTGFSLIQISDGGLLIVGYAGSDGWIIKTDLNGNVEWNQTYGGSMNDVLTHIINTQDGKYAICGHTESFGAGNKDFWLIKIDGQGNVELSKTYGTPIDELAHSVIQTSDNGFGIVGWQESDSTNKKIFLVKTDEEGNLQWNQTFSDTNLETWGSTVIQANDGGFLVVGSSFEWDSGNHRGMVVKFNENGIAPNLLVQTSFPVVEVFTGIILVTYLKRKNARRSEN